MTATTEPTAPAALDLAALPGVPEALVDPWCTPSCVKVRRETEPEAEPWHFARAVLAALTAPLPAPAPAPEVEALAEPEPAPLDPIATEVARVRDALLSSGSVEAERLLGEVLAARAAEVEEQRSAAERLSRRLADTEERLASERARYAADLGGLGEALAEAADRRRFCSEYEEDVTTAAERTLTRPEVFLATALRERDFTVDVPVVAWVTVPARARSEEDAERYAVDSWREYVDPCGLSLDLDRERSPEVSED